MRALMHTLAAAAIAIALAACGDNGKPPVSEDAAPLPIDAAVDAPIDAPPGAIGPCLERPTDLSRPPTGALPCELLPPGFTP
jgi:hypothetical protein